jgi:DASH complex subunit SPC19
VDESTINRYKTDLVDEIEPQITELLDRADKGLKAMAKQESHLQSKV